MHWKCGSQGHWGFPDRIGVVFGGSPMGGILARCGSYGGAAIHYAKNEAYVKV